MGRGEDEGNALLGRAVDLEWMRMKRGQDRVEDLFFPIRPQKAHTLRSNRFPMPMQWTTKRGRRSSLSVALFIFLPIVIARFMRATHGRIARKVAVGGPDKPGHDGERAARVHLNTLEQLMIFLPLLWLATYFFAGPPWLPGAIGLVFLAGRLIFLRAYMADPEKRLPGLVLGMFANVALLVLSLTGLWQHWSADRPAL
jgi:uncharacterized membrane protein YecN with MAPEG domain